MKAAQRVKAIVAFGVSGGCALAALIADPSAYATLPPVTPFTIGVDSPLASETNSSRYQEIKNFNATLVFTSATEGVDGFGPVDAAIAQAASHSLKMIVSDIAHITPGATSQAEVCAITSRYSGNPALEGYFVSDEASADTFTARQQTAWQFKTVPPGNPTCGDPNHMTSFGLFPNDAAPGNWGVSNFSGDYVTSTTPLGQTFTTQAFLNHIDTVEFGVDSTQWTPGEILTLSLWTSVNKSTFIKSVSLAAPGDNFPRFPLNVAVSPNTSYYMELTYSGSGDGSVGWINTSAGGEKFINHGDGYKVGVKQPWDLWFVINQPRLVGGTYDDYVYRWADKVPDVLFYDHYPFKIGGDPVQSDYFENLEIIRMQAKSHGIGFWSYIQSAGSVASNTRIPTASELRFQIYMNLAYGARGYVYFMYWTPHTSSNLDFQGGILVPNAAQTVWSEGPLYAVGQTINGEVLKLGPTLTTLTSIQTYHTGQTIPPNTIVLPASFHMQPQDGWQPLVVGHFATTSGRQYLLIGNRDTVNGRTVTFQFTPKPTTVNEVSKTTGSEVAASYNSTTGILSVTFSAGDGRLFAMPAGYTL